MQHTRAPANALDDFARLLKIGFAASNYRLIGVQSLPLCRLKVSGLLRPMNPGIPADTVLQYHISYQFTQKFRRVLSYSKFVPVISGLP